MTTRALAKTFGAGWLILLAMRLAMNFANAPPGRTLGQLAMVVVPITAIWLPVIAFACRVDRRGGSVIGAHASAAVAITFLEPLVTKTVLGLAGMPRPYGMLFVGRFDTNVLVYAVIVAADLALIRFEAFQRRERSAARLERALADAQLYALAMQLQPHFLFNALQFVAEIAHQDLAMARRTLAHLRALMQQAFTLQQRLEVSLAEEVSFLEAYGEIQRGRFGDRFRLTVDVAPEAARAAVPPLLLQPLVENAARHGFGARGSGGTVTVTARVHSGELSITVADDGLGPSGSGVEGQGLSVTRRRLERLHGGAASLALAREGDWTEARLRIPYREVDPAPVTDQPLEDEARDPGPAATADAVPLGLRLAAFWGGLMSLIVLATAIAPFVGPVGSRPPFSVGRLVADEMVGLPFWAAMTFAAVFAGRRLRGMRALGLHAAIAVTLAAAHVFLGDSVMRAAFGVTYPRDAYAPWAIWDVLAYAALVLLARAHDLREWMSAKAREEVTLSAEVVRASAQLARLGEVQAELLAELDAVIASPTMESLDEAVVAYADFVRDEVLGNAAGATA